MRYFLGIDVGTSRTHALIGDEMGQCVGFERSGEWRLSKPRAMAMLPRKR